MIDKFHDEASAILRRALAGIGATPEISKLWEQVGADKIVEAALFARAIGFSYPSEKVSIDTKTGADYRADIVEYVVPDVAAQMNWLRARLPEKWGDVKKRDDEADLSRLTDADLDTLLEAARVVARARKGESEAEGKA